MTLDRKVLAFLAALAVALVARQAAAQDQSDGITFAVAETDRHAVIVNAPPKGERRPAVVILHGGMGNARDMRSRTGFDQLARAEGFIAAYGEGTDFKDGRPGARARRDENTPIEAFRGAERVWAFFKDKSRTAAQAAAAAPTGVELLEFRDLVDTARPGKATGSGPAGRNVPIKVHLPQGPGPFPVVVVSHGAGGDWDTHFGQAQDLAAHGYAVLCIDHVGSDRERLKAGGLRVMKTIEAMTRDADEVLARPRDVSFALDRATEWNRTHARLRGTLDLQRVAVMGHSYGAYTTMTVCGMRPALDWLTPRVEPGKGLGPDLGDRRVTCGIALSPQGLGEPFFVDESFAGPRRARQRLPSSTFT